MTREQLEHAIRKGVPLKTLRELGGWKTHRTILMCYQHVDEGEMREALEERRAGT